MTTRTPTSNPPQPADARGPAGLPDVADLARLANAFFASLPGSAPSDGVPSGGAPFGKGLSDSALPGGVSALAGVSPVEPFPSGAAASLGAAERHAGETLPAGIADGLELGSPEAYAAALPTLFPAAGGLAPLAGGAPSTPYYFLGEGSAYSGEPERFADLPVEPDSRAVPGGDALGEVLRSILAEPSAPAAPAGPGAGQFYFLERSGPGLEQAPDPVVQPQVRSGFDVQAVRRDFPILAERVNGKPLVWFDNAATTQKPKAVIDRLAYFYEHENSNIHRAAHELAARATDAYEGARSKAARFLGAKSTDEIVFVRGATEGINLLANTFGRRFIGEGDEIIVSHLEHHANIVPWQLLANAVGARLKVIPVDDSGQIILEEYARLLGPRTRLVSITQVSNALGTVTPVAEVIALAHAAGARVLVDGAQSVSHLKVDVRALDADFFVFSGHKVFGPTGIGVVYGKQELLDELPPWQGGGNMIADVTFEKTQYQGAPARFEAGTGNIADAVGLGAALDYVERIGLEAIARYEHELLEYATRGLATIPGLRLIGTAANKASVLSFVLQGYRTEEIGAALNREGVAVRSGHHCAQPILRRFGVETTVRPSLAFYNTFDEIDLLVSTVHRLATRR
ncbi:family 2A encapsulin nanocompartment cargo protein cysteine desulfurase [Azotobacter vinelandii]|uniref:family 2A encapsulin nanocompartment cargo protein cysteine desulfurase n=1 Tax=Azotobacter TaxID=352 RepID=UPI00005272EC|nr:family 2A encapsulin nanocompartment cargo protein cysteine desulfurase [Azotobacter vinelandii]WKN23620.1 cysteine desulfurase [Azotobacter vinelandii]WKN24027.1 cysteine desulfurase [Azotobacter vinelandii]